MKINTKIIIIVVCVSGEGEPKTAILTLLPDSATNAPNKFINMYMRAYD